MDFELHPGVLIALRKLTFNEFEVAEAMRDGELASPQPFENVLLVDMRISGTGVSYRPKLKEWVYRRPEIYLTKDFLRRCQGLPVIYEHPEKAMLDSDSFAKQIVGVMQLPYIKGDDVWGIARIYDRETAKQLSEETLSTSPSVVFRDPQVNYEVQLDNGESMLVEGNPSYIDHLAICERGVWDKGGDATGIRVDSEGSVPVMDDRIFALADSVESLVERIQRVQVKKSIDRLAKRLDKYATRKKAQMSYLRSST
jgi:hypothetical protein